MRESEFQRQVIDLARLYGWRCAHFRSARQLRQDGSTYYSTPVQADGAGWPDLILCRPPRLIAAELKVGRNKVTAEQREWLKAFARCDVEICVWRPEDWDEVERTLRREEA